MTRYPIAPLMAEADVPSMRALRKVFPMNGTTYRQVCDEGLTAARAHRWAARLEVNPYDVWPELILAELDEGIAAWLVECGSAGCGTRFVPRDAKGQQRYCSDRCRLREKARRYRATPQGAQKARDVRRRYYWSDPKIREREAELKARPSARRAEARRRRELRGAARGEAA